MKNKIFTVILIGLLLVTGMALAGCGAKCGNDGNCEVNAATGVINRAGCENLGCRTWDPDKAAEDVMASKATLCDC